MAKALNTVLPVSIPTKSHTASLAYPKVAKASNGLLLVLVALKFCIVVLLVANWYCCMQISLVGSKHGSRSVDMSKGEPIAIVLSPLNALDSSISVLATISIPLIQRMNIQICKNVLYITLEMAEERIAERIDANLMNISIDDLHDLPKQMFDDKIANIIKKTSGKLIVKEYPTASAHSAHFRGLIKELAIKKTFKPDIIFVDYLNICASSRFKGNANVGSYFYIKAIAEELRGLAVETNVPIVSATQTTRSGFVSSDIGLEDTSESFGLPATADLMFALISNEELDDLNQIAIKQLKNRYNDPTINKRFVLGIDRAKMRLFDVSFSEQSELVDSGQEEDLVVFDKTEFNKYDDFKV